MKERETTLVFPTDVLPPTTLLLECNYNSHDFFTVSLLIANVIKC